MLNDRSLYPAENVFNKRTLLDKKWEMNTFTPRAKDPVDSVVAVPLTFVEVCMELDALLGYRGLE
jgi:hypothetical protein